MSQLDNMDTDKEPGQHFHDVETAFVQPNNQLNPDATHAQGLSCKRSALLQEAFDKALAYGLRDPCRQEFGDSFPGLDDALVDALYDTYKQTLTLVRSHCQAEFQQVCEEHGVHAQLRELEPGDGGRPSTSGSLTPLGARRSPLGVRRTPLGVSPLRVGYQSAAVTATGIDTTGASAEVVSHAEAAARLHALRQEATFLQDMLERAHATEARLAEALALRQGTVSKMATTYHRVVSDVKQVYDITRVWPAAPQLGGKSA